MLYERFSECCLADGMLNCSPHRDGFLCGGAPGLSGLPQAGLDTFSHAVPRHFFSGSIHAVPRHAWLWVPGLSGLPKPIFHQLCPPVLYTKAFSASARSPAISSMFLIFWPPGLSGLAPTSPISIASAMLQ